MKIEKPLRWLGGADITTPPVGRMARMDLGTALRVLQRGGPLSMLVSRPLPPIGPRCYELRVADQGVQWRLVYRTDPHHVVVVDLFKKTTQNTPKRALERCRRRLRGYDRKSQ